MDAPGGSGVGMEGDVEGKDGGCDESEKQDGRAPPQHCHDLTCNGARLPAPLCHGVHADPTPAMLLLTMRGGGMSDRFTYRVVAIIADASDADGTSLFLSIKVADPTYAGCGHLAIYTDCNILAKHAESLSALPLFDT